MNESYYRVWDKRGYTYWVIEEDGSEYLYHFMGNNGYYSWYDKTGLFHREDGPAYFIPADVFPERKEYWVHGTNLDKFVSTDEELKAYLNLKAFW